MVDAGGNHQGRLCFTVSAPKAGKRACLVPRCGVYPFLQQFEDYRFSRARFAEAPKVVIFDRPGGFLVNLPRIEGKLRQINWRPREEDDDPQAEETIRRAVLEAGSDAPEQNI